MATTPIAQEDLELLHANEQNFAYLDRRYAALRTRYGDEYVAIRSGRVIAHGRDLDDLLGDIEERGIDPATVLVEFLPDRALALAL
jgi:hypothetical protein